MAIKTRTEETPEVDLTPMIDIVFQLIIFFMVVMAIAVVYGVAIKFPPRGQGNSQDKKGKKDVIVYIQADHIDRDHYLHRDGHLKLNGEEIALTRSKNRENWDDEREQAYNFLQSEIKKLLDKGYNKEVLIIQGDMLTYHKKVMHVIDKGKGLDMDGFSLVPPSIQ